MKELSVLVFVFCPHFELRIVLHCFKVKWFVYKSIADNVLAWNYQYLFNLSTFFYIDVAHLKRNVMN